MPLEGRRAIVLGLARVAIADIDQEIYMPRAQP